MPAVLPGKPQAELQAISIGRWDGRRIIAYISGSALTILSGPSTILHTIYHDSGEPLRAVAFDEKSGQIAACNKQTIYIYKPSTQDGKKLEWFRHHSIQGVDNGSPINTLSWGADQELLSGSSWLQLSSTAEPAYTIWKQALANPAKFALFSHDGAMIASTGQYDRLLKIWRRLSFNVDETRFDVAYLPHPTSITNAYWQKLSRPERSMNGVLYTICADNILRIWTASDPHCLQILQLWAQIDLQESIKPRVYDQRSVSFERYAFLIDCHDFTMATEQAVQGFDSREHENHAVDHLLEVAHRTPDVCVVLDEDGRMSAWGIEDPGSKARKTAHVFNIAHVDGVKLSSLPEVTSQEHYLRVHSFCDNLVGSRLNILAQHFDGRIEWWEAHADVLFDPSPRRNRVRLKALWSGHSSPIRKIVRSVTGKALVSRTSGSEAILWKQVPELDTSRLMMQSALHVEESIQKMCVLDEQDVVILLHYGSISIWDTRAPKAIKLVSQSFELEGQPLCLILLPEVATALQSRHVAAITSDMKGIAWEISIAFVQECKKSENARPASATISEFCRFDLGTERDLAFVIPVDPAGSISTVSGFFDVFARDVVISFNSAGLLRSWTTKVDIDRRCVQWLLTSSVETGVASPSLASGSSIRKAALVDSQKTELTIWDTREAQLEFASNFGDMIRDLDWTSTPDNQSVLAVGFSHHVVLLSQLRYDYLDAGPAWGIIREIQLADMTPHPIGDSVWLSYGDLAVGAGNQLFVYDRRMEVADTLARDLRLPAKQPFSNTLFSVVSRLNGQLPVFHPQFLSQCILRGKMVLAQRIITALEKRLKFHTEGDEIDTFLGLPPESFLKCDERSNPPKREMHSSYTDFTEGEPEEDVLTESLAASLNEKLTVFPISQLSGREQFQLADIIECIATAEAHHRSMDDNASRFLVFFRQGMLRKSQRGGNPHTISWREITWAFHSDSQDILVDLVSRQFQGHMQWEHARESGIFMWLKDASAVRAQFEVVARNQYTRTDEKNPIDCTLHYLALKKKNVLIGLWRMAAWNPEQSSTQKFLGNNFQEARWKTAALKNAYALLGKHRYEYAAAFFLLADSPKDAVNTCINQLGDLQLGIAIARVYEGDDGPTLKGLLENHVLPLAAVEGNRWLASWAFWMLNRRDMAVRAIISPVHTLLDDVESPGLQAKLFLADDPALVILYRQLREKTLQTLRGATQISSRAEWEFLLHTARLYDRMGCDLLALELVCNWEFLRQPASTARPFDAISDPRKMLRRRSSLVVADLPSPKSPKELKTSGMKPPPSSVYEEPDVNSLLDNFGF